MKIMNLVEKRNYIHKHLHQIKEPAINELYNKLQSYLDDTLIEESEEDIKNGNLTSHETFEQEVQSWRHTK
jgi:predicted transcriptional regulator